MQGVGVINDFAVSERLTDDLVLGYHRAAIVVLTVLLILLLSIISVYSGLEHYVTSRRRELALRVCCGAQPAAVFRLVLGHVVRAEVLGAAICGVVSPGLRDLVISGWIGKAVWDPFAELAGLSLTIAVILSAAIPPSLRAARIEPAAVFRMSE
ncbi:MAG: FtsX-like permease family protein [Bryobacteraceae bacterium]